MTEQISPIKQDQDTSPCGLDNRLQTEVDLQVMSAALEEQKKALEQAEHWQEEKAAMGVVSGILLSVAIFMPSLPGISGVPLIIFGTMYILGIIFMLRNGGKHWKREREALGKLVPKVPDIDDTKTLLRMVRLHTLGAMPWTALMLAIHRSWITVLPVVIFFLADRAGRHLPEPVDTQQLRTELSDAEKTLAHFRLPDNSSEPSDPTE